MSLRNDVIAVLAVQEVSQTASEIATLLHDSGATLQHVEEVLTQLLWEKKISYDVIGFLVNGQVTDETYWKLADPSEPTRIIVKRS